eukprot:GHVO01064016.1.p1 GENE.GHVO01064016.1~~GHVO01064016.1.p1  ORF type:complete len:174 (-),score=21.55 GHVO01064016.1:462-941(-)
MSKYSWIAPNRETTHKFAEYDIHGDEVFWESAHSIGFVNNKPFGPGHVLLMSKNVKQSFMDLTPDEVTDMWMTCQNIGRFLRDFYETESTFFAIQDGPASGQSVPHVHAHIMPRWADKAPIGNEVYDKLEAMDRDTTPPRSAEAMREEADGYLKWLSAV